MLGGNNTFSLSLQTCLRGLEIAELTELEMPVIK